MATDDIFINLVTETKKSVANMAKYAVGITAAIAAVRKISLPLKKWRRPFSSRRRQRRNSRRR